MTSFFSCLRCSRLWRFLRLSRGAQYQVCLIVLLLAKMRLKTKYQSSQQLFRVVPLPARDSSVNQFEIKPLVRRIQQMASLVWWRALCLEQALTLSELLQRQSTAHTLFIGVKRDQQTAFAAHAWITVSDEVVLGGPIEAYQVIARYPFLHETHFDETRRPDRNH
ncbi:lasso peptide biosynthesis B2 protein [Tolumonas lignilytica]|uniref:lasso peptide biosynthesis B2 protein n=1 Tax=Tolumonas lignilytica TaxID=1283284 RepID=UPI0009E07E28|nr:lasso peptide biosynthesis B2 protein [Tolumonas lignilytica]